MHPLFGPQQVGKEYYSGYWRKHYTVLAITEHTITVRWEDGRIATHMTSWEEGRDLLVRPGEGARAWPREYSADGIHWHFAPNIARSMAGQCTAAPRPPKGRGGRINPVSA